jgi:hypothetical protein
MILFSSGRLVFRNLAEFRFKPLVVRVTSSLWNGPHMKPEDALYVEWVAHADVLRWSGFVEASGAAMAQFIELDQAAGAEEFA